MKLLKLQKNGREFYGNQQISFPSIETLLLSSLQELQEWDTAALPSRILSSFSRNQTLP
jgi:hypothetical protein